MFSFRGKTPALADDVYRAPGSVVIGDVEIGPGASLWFNTVVRGDVERVRIGARTNIQDNATVHVTLDTWPTIIGCGVTIGHGAVVHGCTIGDHVLVGIGAIVLDGAEIGSECLIGAGALVVPGTKVPQGACVLGAPARVVRRLAAEEIARLHASAANYVRYAQEYRMAGIVATPDLP
jgi:carbonic anhydrase/acetyltransferase-like protein (isoleucine patch superfamily)